MNTGKKLAAAAISAALTLPGFSGLAMADDPVEISIAIWNADAVLAGDEVMESIEEKLGIKIVPQQVSWDDYTQKIQLWASSGSLPDVFIGDFRNTTFYAQWADQGVIHAIPEDLSAYPTLEAYLEGDAAQNAKLDGVLYCLPRQTYGAQEYTIMDRVITYRWDLAQKAGIEKEPENWQEFSDMILAIIEADPDGTGIGGLTSALPGLLTGAFLTYASPVSAEGGGGEGFRWVLDEEDGLYKPAYFVKDTVAALQLVRDMYDTGVISQDVALEKSATDKFLQGKNAAILAAGGFANNYTDIGQYWEEVHGTQFLDDVRALNLMEDVNGSKTYPAWGYAWSESYINSSVSDEKLDRILALFDYLLTDEGSFLSLYGPEGEFYDLVDGKVVLKEEGNGISEKYPSVDGLGLLARWNPSNYDDRFANSKPQEYQDVDKALVAQAAEVELPAYSAEASTIFQSSGVEFTIHFVDDLLAVMTGTEPVEEMWAELVAEYEENGLNEAIEAVNEAMSAE